MPRYLTVEEAATALKTTERTVRRMLNAGRLAGSQTEDKGKMIWRVNATKELMDQLEKIELVNNQSPYSADVVTEAVTDVFEDLDINEEDDAEQHNELNHKDAEQKAFTNANPAESFWTFMEDKILVKLQEKDQAIGKLLSELEDKDRQLKLLPDLEKQAEEKRKDAEFKALEIQALNKQISAMETDKLDLEERAERADALSSEIQMLKAQVEELQNPWWKKWLTPKSFNS